MTHPNIILINFIIIKTIFYYMYKNIYNNLITLMFSIEFLNSIIKPNVWLIFIYKTENIKYTSEFTFTEFSKEKNLNYF